MRTKSIAECDRINRRKLENLQLSHRAKQIGLVIACISFFALFLTVKDTPYKLFAKYSLLIGLLVVVISKEEIEDEYVKNLRMHAFTFAFIFAVFIAITNPLLTYLTNLAFERQDDVFSGIGDWTIMWFLLSSQVFCFEFLKRIYK